MNVKTTYSISFRNNHKPKLKLDLKIYGTATSLSQVANIKRLGVTINKTLTWNDHIQTNLQ